jgi:hypothetical protein
MDLEARCLGGRRFDELSMDERARWLAYWQIDCERRGWFPFDGGG